MRPSFSLPIISDFNAQGQSIISTQWGHQTDVKYSPGDVCTDSFNWYQCILESDASVDAARIPSNATYWTIITSASLTSAEIKTLYEANSDTNAFTDSDKTKLTGIDSGAEVNPTDAEIKTSYESNADTNAFTDAEKVKLDSAIITVPGEYLTQTEGDARYVQPTGFVDTANDTTTLGVDFTTSSGTISGTVDASGLLNIDEKWSGEEADLTSRTFLDTTYVKVVDKTTFLDTANSDNTLGVDFLATGNQITASVDASSFVSRVEGDTRYIQETERSELATRAQGNIADSAVQPGDVSVNGNVSITVAGKTFTPAAMGGGSGEDSRAESIVSWLKNSGTKVFNRTGELLDDITITARDNTMWTQAFNRTDDVLTDITYTYNTGNDGLWGGVIITRAFNRTDGVLTSINYSIEGG